MITVREEQDKDYQAIFKLVSLAFGQDNESLLIDKIRKGPNYIKSLSLVATLNETIVGHILFSKVGIETEGGHIRETLALAPMAVLPEYQRLGVGKVLVTEGLFRAGQKGFGSVIVLGHEDYYPRFGFQRASLWNIRCPFDAPDEAFMALELKEGDLEGSAGVVRYPEEFYEA